MITGFPDMSRTEAALREYDRTEGDRDELIRRAATSSEVFAWHKACAAAIGKVQEALALDTADRNPPQACRHVHIGTIRQWVSSWQAQERAKAKGRAA